MVANPLPILYVKAGCPWCTQAESDLDGLGIKYHSVEVTSDRSAFDEMRRKSGQTKAPTLDWHGKVLADFGTEELIPFLQRQGVPIAHD